MSNQPINRPANVRNERTNTWSNVRMDLNSNIAMLESIAIGKVKCSTTTSADAKIVLLFASVLDRSNRETLIACAFKTGIGRSIKTRFAKLRREEIETTLRRATCQLKAAQANVRFIEKGIEEGRVKAEFENEAFNEVLNLRSSIEKIEETIVICESRLNVLDKIEKIEVSR